MEIILKKNYKIHDEEDGQEISDQSYYPNGKVQGLTNGFSESRRTTNFCLLFKLVSSSILVKKEKKKEQTPIVQISFYCMAT